MASILSQDEIDDLLSAVGGSSEPETPPAETTETDGPAKQEISTGPRWSDPRDFLENSSLAQQIQPELKVRLLKEDISLKELSRRGEAGTFPLPERDNLTAELLVEGKPAARGKIIKKKDQYVFTVEEILA